MPERSDSWKGWPVYVCFTWQHPDRPEIVRKWADIGDIQRNAGETATIPKLLATIAESEQVQLLRTKYGVKIPDDLLLLTANCPYMFARTYDRDDVRNLIMGPLWSWDQLDDWVVESMKYFDQQYYDPITGRMNDEPTITMHFEYTGHAEDMGSTPPDSHAAAATGPTPA